MVTQPRSMSKKDRRLESERMIMVAAEKVFAEAGFGGATMQLIADVAGLPKANLHYYFPTKEALYRRVVQDIFQVWLKAADIFDQASDLDRSFSGFGPSMDIFVPLNMSSDGALSLMAFGVVLANVIYLI